MAIGGDVFSGLVEDAPGVLVRLQPGQRQPQLQRAETDKAATVAVFILGGGGGGSLAYLHARRAALHGSAEHDPGVLRLLQLHGRLPQPNRLGHVLQG